MEEWDKKDVTFRCIAVNDLEAIRKHLMEMESFYLAHFSDTQFDPELIEAGKRVFGWESSTSS